MYNFYTDFYDSFLRNTSSRTDVKSLGLSGSPCLTPVLIRKDGPVVSIFMARVLLMYICFKRLMKVLSCELFCCGEPASKTCLFCWLVSIKLFVILFSSTLMKVWDIRLVGFGITKKNLDNYRFEE